MLSAPQHAKLARPTENGQKRTVTTNLDLSAAVTSCQLY